MKDVRGMTALVTGASYGIGRAAAEELAKLGCDLVLVSRSKDRLEAAAAELSSAYGVKAVAIPEDLAVPGGAGSLCGKCKSLGLSIDILVNDAGFSVKTEEEWTETGRVEEMLELLAVTPPALCARFAEDMKKRGKGYILNVSSASAYFPVGIMRTYSAVKRFLLEYTKGLSFELRPYGVRVTCLAPGGVRSHFFDANSIEVPKRFDWITKIFLMSARRTARTGVRAMLRGQRVVIPGVLTKIYTGLTFLLPKRLSYAFFKWIEWVRCKLAGSPGPDKNFAPPLPAAAIERETVPAGGEKEKTWT